MTIKPRVFISSESRSFGLESVKIEQPKDSKLELFVVFLIKNRFERVPKLFYVRWNLSGLNVTFIAYGYGHFIISRDHSFSRYAKFSKKLIFLTP